MNPKAKEILEKLKELKQLSNDTNIKLNKAGVKITNIPKEELFAYNLKDIFTAMEELIRNEPSEKPRIRLGKAIPKAYENIDKIQKTPEGNVCSEALTRIKTLIKYLEDSHIAL